MYADPELAGVVGDDHRISDQAMMADGAPDTSLGKRSNCLSVKNVDSLGGQMLEKRDLIGEKLHCPALEVHNLKKAMRTSLLTTQMMFIHT